MNQYTEPFENKMSQDEIKSELSQCVHDYHRIYDDLLMLNMHRASAVEDEKLITSELLEKSYEMAYFAGLILGEK